MYFLLLVIMLQAIVVFAIASVFWVRRGLHVGGTPGLWPNGSQKGRRVRSARAYLHIVGLKQGTALMIPVLLQTQNNLLKSEHEGVDAVEAI
jgi:hypothetical protein